MQDPTQPQPGPRTPAGYRPLIPADYSKGMGNSALAYVAAAAGLGLAVGLGVAFTAGHATAPAAPGVTASGVTAPRISATIQNHSSGFTPVPAVYAATVPTLLSKVDPSKAKLDKKPAAGSLLVSATPKSSPARPIEHHKHHAAHRVQRFLGKLLGRQKRKPYVPATTIAEAPTPTALDQANSAAASGPFFLGVEGDVTIAGYEPTTGVLQTYEGETYILAKNLPGTGSINWQNYPFNVHYRCDEVGDCTLIRGHSTAAAKLTR